MRDDNIKDDDNTKGLSHTCKADELCLGAVLGSYAVLLIKLTQVIEIIDVIACSASVFDPIWSRDKRFKFGGGDVPTLSGPKLLQAGGIQRVVTPSLASMGTAASRRVQCLLLAGTYHSKPWSMVWFWGGAETLEEV